MKHIISVIGLGYVGLPVAIEFSKYFETIGYDINQQRIKQLNLNNDVNEEISSKIIKQSKKLIFTSNSKKLRKCNTHIITVPTPINKKNKPDLKHIFYACKQVGKILKKNDFVIFESTVYPGLTEEICIPLLQKHSNLKINNDFYCGYSPERINPGDKKRTLSKIIKITAGSNKFASKIVDNLYKKVIKVGTFNVSSIKVAEAAKVIENTQRDLNVAFINELSMIFHKMKIDTEEVIQAASTKWNFQNFQPGLVGGHCIGVDPYYLTYIAKKIGFNPQTILSGRKVNNNMGKYIIKILNNKLSETNKLNITKKSKILIMGFSYKENCRDIRNTKVIDLINELQKKYNQADIYDPLVNKNEVLKNYKLKLINYPNKNYYDIIIIAVAHKIFKNIGIIKINKFGKKNCIIFDLKYLFEKKYTSMRL